MFKGTHAKFKLSSSMPQVLFSTGPFLVSCADMCKPRVSQACVNSLGSLWCPLSMHATSSRSMPAPTTTPATGYCWLPPVHLYWRCHFQIKHPRSTTAEKLPVLIAFPILAEPHIDLWWWRGIGVAPHQSTSDSHCTYLSDSHCSYPKFSSSPSINTSWIVIRLWSISGAQNGYLC